jgi:hypothetical protein
MHTLTPQRCVRITHCTVTHGAQVASLLASGGRLPPHVACGAFCHGGGRPALAGAIYDRHAGGRGCGLPGLLGQSIVVAELKKPTGSYFGMCTPSPLPRPVWAPAIN